MPPLLSHCSRPKADARAAIESSANADPFHQLSPDQAPRASARCSKTSARPPPGLVQREYASERPLRPAGARIGPQVLQRAPANPAPARDADAGADDCHGRVCILRFEQGAGAEDGTGSSPSNRRPIPAAPAIPTPPAEGASAAANAPAVSIRSGPPYREGDPDVVRRSRRIRRSHSGWCRRGPVRPRGAGGRGRSDDDESGSVVSAVLGKGSIRATTDNIKAALNWKYEPRARQ